MYNTTINQLFRMAHVWRRYTIYLQLALLSGKSSE
jgi:hypothetical protein